MALLDFLRDIPTIDLRSFLTQGFGNKISESQVEKEKGKRIKSGQDAEYYYTIGEQVRKLPYIHQAADLKARIIFSQGMDFKPKDRDLLVDPSRQVQSRIDEDMMKIKTFFERKNGLMQDLNEAIYSAVIETELYGHSGLQIYDWEDPDKAIFQSIKWNQFLLVGNELSRESRGRREIVYYFINLNGFLGERGVQDLLRKGSISIGSDSGYYRYKVLPEEFVLFRLNTESVYGVSPLYYDQLTKQLLLDSLKDNISEVNNEGYKGLILKGRQGVNPRDLGISRESAEMNTNWLQQAVQKYMQEIRTVISGSKNRSNILYLPGGLIEGIDNLERTIKATDYLGFIQAKGAVLAASMLGIHPGFLGEKDSTYAANLSEAIKFAVTYSIESSQQKYEKIINTQIFDRYLNDTGYLNYEYEADIRPADTADRGKEAEVMRAFADFITKLKQEGITGTDESIRFINEQGFDGLNIAEIGGEDGETKTTIRPLYPVEFKEIQDEE